MILPRIPQWEKEEKGVRYSFEFAVMWADDGGREKKAKHFFLWGLGYMDIIHMDANSEYMLRPYMQPT